MGALANLWNSEKAITGGVLVIAATVLAALGHMTVDAWREYTMVIFGLYIGGKTVQGAAAAIASRPASTPTPAQAGQQTAVVVNTEPQ